MKGIDEWTSKAGYEIYDLPTEVVILDQHVQCLHHACKLHLSPNNVCVQVLDMYSIIHISLLFSFTTYLVTLIYIVE